MVKPGGFIDKLLKSLKNQIDYQPELVGEIHFSALPAFFNGPGDLRVSNALGSTITIIRQIYPKLTNIGDLIATAGLTADGIADALLFISEKLLFHLGLGNGAPNRLKFGSIMICFLPLNAVLELFLANLAGRKPEIPIEIFSSRIEAVLEMAIKIWPNQPCCAAAEKQVCH